MMKVLVIVLLLLLVLISGNINITSSILNDYHNRYNDSITNIHSDSITSSISKNTMNNTVILMTNVINEYHRRLNLANGLGLVQFAKYSTGISGIMITCSTTNLY